MRHLSSLVVAAALFALPMTAHAGFILEGSIGSGLSLKPELGDVMPANIMLAPGYGLGEMVRLELGLVFPLKDFRSGFALRPMLVVDPPILPLYVRLSAAASNIFEDTRTYAIGGALGLGFSLLGLGVFAELGVLPQFIKDADAMWILEGRLGAYYAF